MNYIPPQHSIIGGVIDDARSRWLAAEREAVDAEKARVGNPDPEVNRNANARRFIADRLKEQLDIAMEVAAETADAPPLRTIRLPAKTTFLGTLGTVAILASPLAVAALLIRRL